MADTHQLVVNLLLFSLQLHLIWQRLPFAASAYAKMLAERLQTMLRWFYHAKNEAFHVIFLLLCDLYVHDVAGNCKLYEQHSAVDLRKCLAFGSHSFDHDVL